MKSITITERITERTSDSFTQYLKDIKKCGTFTGEEEKICAIKASNGDETARQELVNKNLRFVISVAKQFVTKDVFLEDLVNEGNIGLITASKSFDPSRGVKFISYSVSWIQKYIYTYLNNNSRTVRLPINRVNDLRKATTMANKMEQELGRTVTLSEAIEQLNPDDLNGDLKSLKVAGSLFVDSLDRDISDDDSKATIGDLIASDNTTDDEVNLSDVKQQIIKLLDTIKPREKTVIVGLYGLDGNLPKTLNTLGEELGISREMVRQIREKALLKLKKKLTFAGTNILNGLNLN